MAPVAPAEDGGVSLPLMGIGNSRIDAIVLPLAVAAHYPSWGSETRQAIRAAPPVARQLITPHGDRKRHRRSSPRLEQARRRLITPHGDRKHAWARSSAVRCHASLPLMGIGNWNIRLDSRFRLHSLPLMGIGNFTATNATGSDTYTSLPLMGIGNPGPPGKSMRRLTLITPHGDRKPRRSAMPSSSLRTHYPSWGSETRCASTGTPAPVPAHYPSWGSETPVRGAGGRPMTGCSLPLMGIGNGPARGCRCVDEGCSLPLMGIGNSAAGPSYR